MAAAAGPAARWGPAGQFTLAIVGVILLVLVVDRWPKIGIPLVAVLVITMLYRLRAQGKFPFMGKL